MATDLGDLTVRPVFANTSLRFLLPPFRSSFSVYFSQTYLGLPPFIPFLAPSFRNFFNKSQFLEPELDVPHSSTLFYSFMLSFTHFQLDFPSYTPSLLFITHIHTLHICSNISLPLAFSPFPPLSLSFPLVYSFLTFFPIYFCFFPSFLLLSLY